MIKILRKDFLERSGDPARLILFSYIMSLGTSNGSVLVYHLTSGLLHKELSVHSCEVKWVCIVTLRSQTESILEKSSGRIFYSEYSAVVIICLKVLNNKYSCLSNGYVNQGWTLIVCFVKGYYAVENFF